MANTGINTQQLLEGGLEPLLISVLDKTASDTEFAALVDSLRESEQLRRRAAAFLCDESLLFEQIGTAQQASNLLQMLSERSSSDPGLSDSKSVVRTKPVRFRLFEYVNSHGLAIAAIAAFVTIGLIAHNLIMMSQMSRLHSLVVQGESQGKVEVVVDEEGGHHLATSKSGGEIIGRVIGMKDIEWPKDVQELSFGDTLSDGSRIHFDSGALEILLANGAKVTAEGPVDFEVESLLSMDLDRGKVAAAVPRTARGYTIMTPTSEVVDIGTHFGVSVSDSGVTELHVFDGDVVARSRLTDATVELFHASVNEAFRFDSESIEPHRFSARKEDFTRWVAPTIPENQLPPLPITDELVIWYSADVIPEAVNGDSIPIWRDILVGDNDFPNDARQFDARLAPVFGADGKKRPMLTFNGTSTSLETDSLESTGSGTVFVAFSPGDSVRASEYHGGILFKYGHYPTLEMSVLRDRAARAWVWAGDEMGNVGELISSPVTRDEISVMSYRYDSIDSRANLWINGVPQGKANGPVELPQFAKAYLGSHYDAAYGAFFSGAIYEIIVYDESLDDISMASLWAYFSKRYDTNQSN